jgi:hypothetical protein
MTSCVWFRGLIRPLVVAALVALGLLGVPACAQSSLPSSFERTVTNLRIADYDVTVSADAMGNSCETPKLLKVREAADEVVVTVLIEQEGDICQDIALITPMTAVIGEPLDGRALVSRCPEGVECR